MKPLLCFALLLSFGASSAVAQQDRHEEERKRREVESYYFHRVPEARAFTWRDDGLAPRMFAFGDGFFPRGERSLLDGDSLRFNAFSDLFFGDGTYFLDEELMTMERRSRELAAQARRAEGTERDRIERELDDLLVQIFERKQEVRAEQIESLEARLRDLRDEQQQRQARQREIIERRKRQLLGDEDPLRW